MPGHAGERINPRVPGVVRTCSSNSPISCGLEIEGIPKFVDLLRRQTARRDLPLDFLAGLVGRHLSLG